MVLSERDQPSYREHRRELLRTRLTTVTLAVIGMTLAFEVVNFVMVPDQWLSEWLSNVLLILVPCGALILGRTRLHPELVFLATDLFYTLAIVSRLLQPAAFTSGIEAFTSIKLMGAAVLIPWSARLQAIAAGTTLILYWTMFLVSGRASVPSGDLPHQLTSPMFAAMLSVVGVIGAERLRRQLFLQQRAAEREARVSSHFAATMSHELRNLLGAVQGYGEILAYDSGHGLGASSDVPQRLQAIALQGLDVINVTLDLSRAEHDRLPLQLDQVELATLFGELAEEFARRTTGAEVELKWDAGADGLQLHTDSVKLKMVLRNLVGNALKFTSRGSVRVAARRQGDTVEIEVTDSGPGIAREEVMAIFEPFQQSVAGRGRSGSAGLGLYLVSRVVAALGGQVEVNSELGSGSTFRVLIPIDAGSPAARPPAGNGALEH